MTLSPLKLYYAPGACSLAPHIVLRETGLPFTLVRVDLASGTVATGGKLRSINPAGLVPVLELADGSRLTEGPVICQYLADRAGATSLMPAAGTLERYRVMAWQNFITSELHKSYSPLFARKVDATALGILAGALRDKLARLDGQLSGRPYLAGDDFTAADAYLFTVLRWSPLVGLAIDDLGHLAAHSARVLARPSVRDALAAESLPTGDGDGDGNGNGGGDGDGDGDCDVVTATA